MQLDFISQTPIGAIPGSKRSRTPDGSLLCRDVPIARTGSMQYARGETPVQDSDGWVTITRDEAEVFKPGSMHSMNGRPVTMDHPFYDVTPDNWARLSKGTVFNVRRGTGSDADLLVADLMIMDAQAIKDVEAGRREVSCGYSAEYLQDAPGRGRQVDIMYNHLALVERGRCGPRCAIGDRHPGGPHVADRRTFWDKMKRAVTARDKDYVDALISRWTDEDEDDPKHKHDHDHPDAHASGEGGDMHHIEIHNHLPTGDVRVRRRDSVESGGGTEEIADPGNAGASGASVSGQGGGSASSSPTAGLGNYGGESNKDSESMTEEEKKEVEKKREETEDRIARRVVDMLRKAGIGKDVEGAEAEGDPTNKKILGELEFEAPPGTAADRVARATDSVLFADSVQDMFALGAAICPGHRLPVFTRDMAPRATHDMMCAYRRDVLTLAANQPATRALVGDALGGRGIPTDCGHLRAAFNAVGAACREKNRSSTGDAVHSLTSAGLPIGPNRKIRTVADIQAAANAHYEKMRARQFAGMR